jgi:hypothetical protein
MTPAKEHRQPSEESKREELALVRAESNAYSRFTRLKVAFDDAAVVEAAKTLWSEAAAAVRGYQAKITALDRRAQQSMPGGRQRLIPTPPRPAAVSSRGSAPRCPAPSKPWLSLRRP